MSNIKDLSAKVNSLRNMQKVMRAMNMISSIKLHKLLTVQKSLMVFTQSLITLQKQISAVSTDSLSPAAIGYPEVKKVHVILFTADKGLCGTHNSSVLKALNQFVEQKKSENVGVELTCIGNKGANFCKRKEFDIFQKSEINDRYFTHSMLQELSAKVLQRFINNEVQEVICIGNIYYSTLRQDTETTKLLPFTLPLANEDNPFSSMMTEPEDPQFINAAAEIYLFYKLNSLLLNSYLSEQSSRMTAMENATHNSEDLITKYITIQNHARQTSITNELIEIVSGKEALKG